VDNSDGRGLPDVQGNIFEIRRPQATLRALCAGSGSLRLGVGKIDVPEEHGVHPFVEVDSTAELDHVLITVCSAQRAGNNHGALTVGRAASRWTISGTHNGKTIDLQLDMEREDPVVQS
jgi:hypothetical protein